MDNLKAIASLSGKTTTVGADTVTVMTDAKNADGTQGTDGIDDTDASIITKENAYKLAANELAAANKIGDTEGASSVTNNNDGTFLQENSSQFHFLPSARREVRHLDRRLPS